MTAARKRTFLEEIREGLEACRDRRDTLPRHKLAAPRREGDECDRNDVSPKTRLDATDDAVKFSIRHRANRTVVAVLVHSQQRVIQGDGALFDLAHGPKLRNRLTCPGDDNSFAPLYSRNEVREVNLRIGDIDGFAAHAHSLAKPRCNNQAG